ncbi:cobyrinate a,c-diamide synthase [Roseibium polysiphoniae]|uniref:Hydrogenobyrinate a,c-diamide synthase n=1 Tax=Roseibium polysiphoniae TaxID=2571221 RepID=A0A944CFV4_9HYPH|nr:cobyrinate a,c-diamide synthase [Roseibium polysiphoniae]MBS8262410.1 cobyrinate a,c-diamide synthase [Roseibium polysiphoniae]
MISAVPKGVLIAAPQSGAGKTTVTLALLRALRNRGTAVASAKSGPDYIDPKFHEAASGSPCINLDAWAMPISQIRTLACDQANGAELLVIEGAMGLFDGAANGRGSAADLAAALGIPVVMVIDCSKQAQSVAALVSGFQHFRKDLSIAGLILNRVGSARHEAMLRRALEPLAIPVLGALPRDDRLAVPERHLGLVQAGEHDELEQFLDEAADLCANQIDLDGLQQAAGSIAHHATTDRDTLPPFGQRIAIARDVAFSFAYPHLLDGWKKAGAELSFFSPLEDQPPQSDADAIYLPGGYPELHAGKLSAASIFKTAMQQSAERGTLIYGECGGYMTLGDGLVDAKGKRHEMLGLLPLETSFADRKRHLGYRVLTPLGRLPWTQTLSAHEFHYASTVREGRAERLFSAMDAEGAQLADLGLRIGSVMGSFAHVIAARSEDRALP